VRDATVVGLPHAVYGEEVAALIQVTPADQHSALAGDITGSLEGKLARFKIPTSVHITDQDLPRTATGKVLKRQIRDQLVAERR
jgi:long-chain acyl-CoA synthetase